MGSVSPGRKYSRITGNNSICGQKICRKGNCISKKEIVHSDFQYEFFVEKEKGTSIVWAEATKEMFSEDFFLKSNARMEMYLGSRDKVYQHIPIREQYLSDFAHQRVEELLFVAKGGVLLQSCTGIASNAENSKGRMTVEQIRGCCQGDKVPVPCWVGSLLWEWNRKGQYRMSDEVKRIIANGKISSRLLKLLYLCYTRER